MRRLTIVTAKMRRRFFRMILDGRKPFEVRDESLDGVQAIRYVDAENGEELGTYRLGHVLDMERTCDGELMQLAGIGPTDFYELFPPTEDGGPSRLWAAELLERTTLDRLLEKG